MGVAFDGDADRALFVDETASVVSGDHVMFAIGVAMHDRGELAGSAIVGTVMSNIGFERALRARGIALIRAAVGDRYVLERMRDGGYVLGGEQSGHVIDLRRNTTGDGPMTAATLFGIVCGSKTPLHELVRGRRRRCRKCCVNVRTAALRCARRAGRPRRDRGGRNRARRDGRLLVRASGTEPLIRVMAEGDDRPLVEQSRGRGRRRDREGDRDRGVNPSQSRSGSQGFRNVTPAQDH